MHARLTHLEPIVGKLRTVRRVAVCTVCLLCPGAVHAQSTTIRVLDSLGVPIPFAVVNGPRINNRVADSSGTVRVAGSFRDTVHLKVRRIGYAAFDGPVVRNAEDGAYHAVLARVTAELQQVSVIATRSTPLSRSGFYDRMQRVQRGAIVGDFITPEELEQRRPMQVSRVLYGRQHVQVIPRGSGGRTLYTLAGRGGRCPMTILLDGVRMNGVVPPPGAKSDGGRSANAALTVDDLVDAGSVSGIEIYPSTANAPAELIPLTGGGSCGIVAIWTGGRH